MKIWKVWIDAEHLHYVSAESEEGAKEIAVKEDFLDGIEEIEDIAKVEELPESEWGKTFVSFENEDGEFERFPITELLESTPSYLASNYEW